MMRPGVGGELNEPLLQPRGGVTEQPPAAASRGLLFSAFKPTLGRRPVLDALRLRAGLEDASACLQRRLRSHPDEALARSLLVVFWPLLARAAWYKLLSDLLRYVPPVLLAQLLSRLVTCSPLEAYSLALALPLTTLAQALLVNQYFWLALRLGVDVRGALAAAVCRRTLRYRRCCRADGGKLSNLVSSDCGRLNTLCGCINIAWSAPLQLLLALALLWRSLGACVLGGLGVLLLLWPVQLALSRALARQRTRTARATDERLQRTEAALATMRAVKLEGWEELCEAEVRTARRAERVRPVPHHTMYARTCILMRMARALPVGAGAHRAPRRAYRAAARGGAQGRQRAARDRRPHARLALDLLGAGALRRAAARLDGLRLARAPQPAPVHAHPCASSHVCGTCMVCAGLRLARALQPAPLAALGAARALLGYRPRPRRPHQVTRAPPS